MVEVAGGEPGLQPEEERQDGGEDDLDVEARDPGQRRPPLADVCDELQQEEERAALCQLEGRRP